MLTDWRVAATAAIFCTGLLVTCIETSAQSVPKDIAARTEIYAIPSLTISDQQFLTGDANGKQVTVAGEFRIAQGGGKLPVVVLMHGSSGVGAGMDPWVRHLNAMGISTFVIDGFSGRGLTAVGPNQGLLGRLNFIVDIYRSLEILGKHPRVDPDRIVLMGFSRGGQATLYGKDGVTVPTRLRQLSDAADGLTRTFEARYVLKGDLADAPLGATVTVEIADGHSSSKGDLQVPVGALFDAGKGPGVWVINGNPAKVTWRPVTVQRLSDEGARIAGQLRHGDRIVALGAHLLREGEQVRVAGQPAIAATAGASR